MMRAIPVYARRRLAAYLAGRDDDEARELLRFVSPGRRPVKPAKSERLAKERTDRAEHRESAAGLRRFVLDRAAGFCEWCGRPAALQIHHVLGGPDRKVKESPTTVAALCGSCHQGPMGWHSRHPRPALLLARAWAQRRNFSEALAAIEKRLARIERQHPEAA